MTPLPIAYVASRQGHTVPPADNLFRSGFLETMRFSAGALPLWPLHRARLIRCAGTTGEELEQIESALMRVELCCGDKVNDARVRLRYGDTLAGRMWDISAYPLDAAADNKLELCLVTCKTRLPVGGSDYRGCKSLDRSLYLRAEKELGQSGRSWADGAEGLLLDHRDNVVETLRCNLLLHIDGHWVTPDLTHSGVRGVMRDWLTGKVSIKEQAINLPMLARAQEVAVCNSVRGVIPVTSLERGRTLPVGEETARLKRLIAQSLW